jgi:hypothetical protein
VGGRNRFALRAAANLLPEDHQPVVVAELERAQQHRVHHPEDRGVDPETERQGQRDDQREGGLLPDGS